MIQSFSCIETERLWSGSLSRKLPADIQQRALAKLNMIDAADTLDDLKLPPSNRLHELERDRAGQHSISINMKWRICFRWNNGSAYDVEIVDYH
ncbi:type II toxin-antitoxin system RelE/ParE family toxin [Porphyrobacter sp. SLTP]|uniref:type II toxin-antitoxin system RelE/ParE family toxin n=1 Tax=Porphyrobacter sp. SLTP TaxID=2683266 RepID=UPI00141271B2|nr:type II toxin-antitoxin system RelE/ParE family toxin [Porphyrobacter sp. SLTP]NBB26491.1 type II toxin-antitoxin system RelE/ParE family toxin [Porphyrobacter sp. SLTP]